MADYTTALYPAASGRGIKNVIKKTALRQRLIFKKISTDHKNTLHSKLDGGFGSDLGD